MTTIDRPITADELLDAATLSGLPFAHVKAHGWVLPISGLFS